jgi:hypothetical protein
MQQWPRRFTQNSKAYLLRRQRAIAVGARADTQHHVAAPYLRKGQCIAAAKDTHYGILRMLRQILLGSYKALAEEGMI